MEIRALLSAMSRGKTGPLLVAIQVALTLAVIINVAYLVHERQRLMNAPTGLDLENTFWIQMQLEKPMDAGYASMVQADEQYLNALPDVTAASITGAVPQTYNVMGLPFAASPQALEKPAGAAGARIFIGSTRYLDALGLKLVAGRNFDPAVIAPPAVDVITTLGNWPAETLVTQPLANKLFPQGDALGKTIYVGLVNKPTTIVGIIGEFRSAPMSGRGEEFSQMSVVVPAIWPGPIFTYLVRAKPGMRASLMAQLEKDFAERAPDRFISRMQTMERTAALSRSGLRSSTIILTTVATVVALVTMLGVAGLAAFNVAARRKQLGTRRALGATKWHILRYFMVENWLITTLGCLLGCALAIGIGIQMSQMYQLPRVPLFYLVGGVLGTWVLGLLSVLLPAQRAASISPATATRSV